MVHGELAYLQEIGEVLQELVKGHLPAADWTGLTTLQPLIYACQVEVVVALS